MKIKKKELIKVGWFIGVSLTIAIIGIIGYEVIKERFPTEGTFLWWPFNPADFIFISLVILTIAVGYLFFRNYKKAIDKKRSL